MAHIITDTEAQTLARIAKSLIGPIVRQGLIQKRNMDDAVQELLLAAASNGWCRSSFRTVKTSRNLFDSELGGRILSGGKAYSTATTVLHTPILSPAAFRSSASSGHGYSG